MIAEDLWVANFSFKETPPAFKGRVLARTRLIAHRKQWNNTPTNNMISRQMQRAAERAMVK
jgi:hypothetical protein